MTKVEIQGRLSSSHDAIINFIDLLSEAEFMIQKADKWTAGQQIEHLIISTQPLKILRWLPVFLIKNKFGLANRPSKTYDELVARYKEKLALGGTAPSRFNPKKVAFTAKKGLNKTLLSNVDTLKKVAGRFSEVELDTLIIPHPLLGKLTLREMLMFTAYHALHHLEITKRNLYS